MEKMSHNDYLLKKQNELRMVTEKLINDEFDIIEGCRHILKLLNSLIAPV